MPVSTPFAEPVLLALKPTGTSALIGDTQIGGDEVLEVGFVCGPAPAMCILVVSECRA